MEPTQSELFKNRTKNVNAYYKNMRFLFNFILFDLGGGPRKIKVAHVVSAVCLTLIPVTIFLKFHFGINSFQSWWTSSLYLSYLFVWPMKGHFFPDESWEQNLTYLSSIAFAVFNLSELCAGYYFVSGLRTNPYPLDDTLWLALCTVLYVLGVLIFTLSDAQKHFVLKYQKQRELFMDGFYKYVRHPNYLGQAMVYTSLMLMAFEWIPFIIYISIFILIFYTNIKIKESSMSRYPQWTSYKKNTGMLLPKLWK